MAKRRKTPEQIVDKQIQRAQQAVPDYIAGIDSVTESPNAKAAEKVNKYAAGVQAAVQNGTFVEANMAVGLEPWKQAAKAKGQRNYAQGVADSKQKLLKFQRSYGPVRDAITDQVNSMPDDTFEQRLQKADAMARGLHSQPYKRKGM